MLSFNDQELASITELASPLPNAMRSDFLQLVANRIADYPPQARGLGLLHRIAAEAQRDFLKTSAVAVGKSKPPSSFPQTVRRRSGGMRPRVESTSQ